MSRYAIEIDDDNATECECPEQLCTHPDGFRYYTIWNVVDTVTGKPVEWYDRQRDAAAEAKRLNEAS